MADQPDLDQLAKQYLDLWQDHMQSMAADPNIAETMSQMTQMMTGSATAFAALAQQAMAAQNSSTAGNTTETTPDEQTDDRQTDAGPAAGEGSPPSAVSRGGPDIDNAELARRLDGIERRLADIEARIDGPREGIGKGSRGGSV